MQCSALHVLSSKKVYPTIQLVDDGTFPTLPQESTLTL